MASESPGKSFERARELAGLSAADVARRADVALSTVRNAERGLHTPTLATQRAMANVIDRRPEDFWSASTLTPARRRRQEIRMTSHELARRAQVSRRTVVRVEGGERVRPPLAFRIAGVLDLPVADVLPPLPEVDA